MLKCQNDSEKDGNLIIKAIEGALIVLVFLVQRPDVGCDKINVILRSISMSSWINYCETVIHFAKKGVREHQRKVSRKVLT
jgi:hypothetical protein